MKNKKAILMKSVASALMAFATLSAESGNTKSKKTPDVAEKNGECHGVNSCKGKGECGGPGYSCAGNNECKGKGWLTLSQSDCKKRGGKFKSDGAH